MNAILNNGKVAYTMHKKSKYAIFCFLIALNGSVMADPICLSWDKPTKRENNATLPTSELSGVVIEYSYYVGNTKYTRKTPILKATSKCFDFPTKSIFNFVAYSVDSTGLYSKPSVTIQKANYVF